MIEALDIWLTYPREIEYDLAVHHNVCIGEWLRGDMSSRKFLLLLSGLLAEGDDTWLRRAMIADHAEAEAQIKRDKERLHQAEFRARIYGRPLAMADLN